MTYDWACNACNKEIAIQRRMADSEIGPDIACECGALEFRRLITIDPKSRNYILNGRGWHNVEYSKTRSIK